ncbi:MAG TPA: hypothetical protein GX513_10360 [Firmicutes bacterium]|nr:hypothetical protein [Bacillota bacterium]
MQYTVALPDRSTWLSPLAIGRVVRRGGKLCRILGVYFGADPGLPLEERKICQWLILEDVDNRSSFWYVLQARPRKEESVEAALGHEGLEVLFPRLLYRSRPEPKGRHPRRGRPPKNTAGVCDKLEPLFPGYLFVLLARSDVRGWDLVRTNPWVLRVLGTGDEPVPVPDEAIDIILERSFGSGIVVFENSRPAWRELEAGARVQITEEPLRDLVGILEKPTSGRNRVRVLLQILGQEVPVDVDVASLRPV